MTSNFWRSKRILLTGGAGFLGSFVKEQLLKEGTDIDKIRVPRSKDVDLRKWGNCLKAIKDINIVIHLAANVGGIGYNLEFPGTLFFDNAIMGIQLMEASRLEGVDKFVDIGTICAYPKYTSIPFKEENLWNGYPEETNAPYGMAKKMLLVQAQAYRQQFGLNAIYLLPVNLYGPMDNFDPKRSHVIPSLIKKMFDAKRERLNKVILWGTGEATREFLYVEDAAKAIVLATQTYNKPDPVNIGAGFEIRIKALAEIIAKLIGFNGKIIWDKSKPDGQPRRMLDTTKAEKNFGFKAKTSLEEGLLKTIEWYKNEGL